MRRKAKPKREAADWVCFRARVVLKPAVSLDDLKTDTEFDPEGAVEFVTLIRALRKEGARPVTL